MIHKIFGNENAEKDDSLIACRVDFSSMQSLNPILTGRWGTGKTASLLINNFDLSNTLRNIDPNIERIWYIDENTLNVKALMELRRHVSTDRRLFIKVLEDIWKAEIIRRGCLLISYLGEYHGHGNGPHWKFVNFIKDRRHIIKSIWHNLSAAFKIILGTERGKAANDIEDTLKDIFTEEAFVHLQNCIKDMSNNLPKPLIAIEPIESPTSALEEETGLAQGMITSLLNVYCSTFQPDSRQSLEVRLCIPWHRFISDQIDFPQKLRQYLEYISWTNLSLKTFINRRIEWEFNRVKRSFQAKGKIDAWNTLFDSEIKNDHCNPPINEDSFEYVLRHSHHRPRDIQRLAREAVEIFAKRIERSVDDVLAGKGGLKVTQERIRQGVRTIGRLSADDLITEAGRRFPQIRLIVDAMKGIKVPFDTDTLSKKIRDQGVDLKPAMDILWASGIIGVEIVPNNESQRSSLRSILPGSSYKVYRNYQGPDFHRFYLFYYNWGGDPNEILSRYSGSQDATAKMVIHPKMFEYLLADVATECPIGA